MAGADPGPGAPGPRPLIDSYGPGRFRAGGHTYPGSILVLPAGIQSWSVARASDLAIESFAAVTAADAGVDIVLLGCGARPVPVAAEIRRALKAAGVSLDAMDTGAACRTYNLLAAEGRRVAAALIAMPLE